MVELSTARAKEWLEERFYVPLAVSALLLAIGSGAVLESVFVGIPFIVVAALIGYAGVRFRDGRDVSRADLLWEIDELREKVGAATELTIAAVGQRSALIESALSQFSQAAGLGNEARVSLYRLTPEGWQREGRVSSNLQYMRSGREVLPVGGGCIHQAYVLGEYFLDNLPDPQSAAVGFYDEHKRMGVAKGVVRAFTMASRSYAAFAFGRTEYERDLVLMAESTDANGLDRDVLKRLLTKDVRNLIDGLVRLPVARGGEVAPQVAGVS